MPFSFFSFFFLFVFSVLLVSVLAAPLPSGANTLSVASSQLDRRVPTILPAFKTTLAALAKKLGIPMERVLEALASVHMGTFNSLVAGAKALADKGLDKTIGAFLKTVLPNA